MALIWAIWSYNFKERGGRRQWKTKRDSAAGDRVISTTASLLSLGNCPLVPAGTLHIALKPGQHPPATRHTWGSWGYLHPWKERPNVVPACPDHTHCRTTDCTCISVGMAGKLTLFSSTLKHFWQQSFQVTQTRAEAEMPSLWGVCILRGHSSLNSLMLSKWWV